MGFMNGLKARKQRKNSPTYNRQDTSDQIYYAERSKYICAALSQFEYEGVDETCNMIVFEQSLLYKGSCAALTKGNSDYIITLPYVTESGKRELYGTPWSIIGIARNTYNDHIKASKFEVCYDTIQQMPGFVESVTNTMSIIEMYAMLKWECINTFRANLFAQNCPYIVQTEKKNQLSWANFWEMFQDFRPWVMVEKGVDVEDAVKAFDTKVPYIGEQLLAAASVIDDMALWALGYPRGTSKQERQIVSETIANTLIGGCETLSRLVPREDFIKRYNRTFGRSASVHMRTSPILDMMALYGEGGLKNVQSDVSPVL